MNPFNLTPQKIIFEALKKLDGNGISKAILYFNVQTDKYSIMLQKEDNKSMKLDIEHAEITLLKKFLINRILRKYRETSNKELKAVIIEVKVSEEDFSVFTEDTKDKVELFTY
jgi:hypothetical protein